MTVHSLKTFIEVSHLDNISLGFATVRLQDDHMLTLFEMIKAVCKDPLKIYVLQCFT